MDNGGVETILDSALWQCNNDYDVDVDDDDDDNGDGDDDDDGENDGGTKLSPLA